MSKQKVKLRKLKNTGFTFALLSSLLNEAILKENLQLKNFVLSILNRYFKNSEIYKELKIHDKVLKSRTLNENRYKFLMQNLILEMKQIDHKKLDEEKRRMIKEFKLFFSEPELKEILKIKIPDYKITNSTHNLIEYFKNPLKFDDDFLKTNFTTIKEHITSNKTIDKSVLEEFKQLDKTSREIAINLALQKFNQKWTSLSRDQKKLLETYILYGFTPEIKNLIKEYKAKIRKKILNEAKNQKNKILQIKFTELNKQFDRIINEEKLNEQTILNLLRSLELLK